MPFAAPSLVHVYNISLRAWHIHTAAVHAAAAYVLNFPRFKMCIVGYFHVLHVIGNLLLGI